MPLLQEFKDYVADSGVDFDLLSTSEKREWRESFNKFLSKLVHHLNYLPLTYPLCVPAGSQATAIVPTG